MTDRPEDQDPPAPADPPVVEDRLEDEDRLPWLEAVEEEGDGEGPSVAKLIGAILVGLVAIGLVVGGLFFLGDRNRGGQDGEIVAAPEGDCNVRPDDPGGMNPEGTGGTAHAASEGADPKGRMGTRSVPPVASGQPAAPGTQTAAPATRPGAPRPGTPAPAPGTGPQIQLGAFSSQAAAEQAWSALSSRFAYLAPLSHNVVPVQSGGRTLYRLRAGGADAAGICRRLEMAGEVCAPVS